MNVPTYILTERILIEEYTNVAETGLAEDPSWVFLKNANANITYKTGGTQYLEEGPAAFDRIDIVIYYDDDIDLENPTKYRVIYNNQKFRINHIQQVGKRIYLRLAAVVFYENS